MRLSLIIPIILIISNGLLAQEKSVCGYTDDRVPSYDRKIARILRTSDNAVCTATLIGRSCMVTAGHCKVALDLVEFDVPKSSSFGINHSDKVNQFLVDRSTVVSPLDIYRNDWAVFRVLANSETGKFPGDERGFYEASFDLAKAGEALSITGYGEDSERSRKYTQQTHNDFLVEVLKGIGKYLYRVDTTGGNSGAAIISKRSGKIIGIHTDGGCYLDRYGNSGVALALNSDFQKALRECLKADLQKQ